jgi:hypothetical protein
MDEWRVGDAVIAGLFIEKAATLSRRPRHPCRWPASARYTSKTIIYFKVLHQQNGLAFHLLFPGRYNPSLRKNWEATWNG